jgi:hypothetical protein
VYLLCYLCEINTYCWVWNEDHLELEQGGNFRTEDQGQKHSNNWESHTSLHCFNHFTCGRVLHTGVWHCSMVELHWCFRGTYCSIFRVEECTKQATRTRASYLLPAQPTLWPWRWRQNTPPEGQLTSISPQGATFWKIIFFIFHSQENTYQATSNFFVATGNSYDLMYVASCDCISSFVFQSFVTICFMAEVSVLLAQRF